jgi:hypothetical protein
MSAKEPGTAIVTWKEKMAMVTAQAAAMEAPKGGFLSFKSGRLSYDDTPIPGDKMNVVIIDFLLENGMFREKYNAMKPASPMCYAFGREESELKPHPDCEEPQHTDCATCPNNEWGSDPEGGRGKACKNSRRIAVIPADTLLSGVDAIKKANVVMCKLPVTSIKIFSKYVNQIVKVLEKPPFAMVTELSLTPNPATIFQVNWKAVDEVRGDDLLQALYEKHVATEKLLFQPYPKMEEDTAPATANKKY